MATLKNTDRDEVVRRALTEAFAPRFVAIQKQLQSLLRDKLQKEHPEFLKLVKNQDTCRYLATTNARNIYFVDGDDIHIAAAPVYGERAEMPEHSRYYRVERERHTLIQDGDTVIPCNMGDFKVSDRKVLKEYRKAWADYVAACDKLYALLYSYNVREKFTADFPEFAKYLPALAVKAKLPAVIVNDVRAELGKFGIPQK